MAKVHFEPPVPSEARDSRRPRAPTSCAPLTHPAIAHSETSPSSETTPSSAFDMWAGCDLAEHLNFVLFGPALPKRVAQLRDDLGVRSKPTAAMRRIAQQPPAEIQPPAAAFANVTLPGGWRSAHRSWYEDRCGRVLVKQPTWLDVLWCSAAEAASREGAKAAAKPQVKEEPHIQVPSQIQPRESTADIADRCAARFLPHQVEELVHPGRMRPL
ncbi:unnamed protein product [Cutaneotrichosporon oleaginosum]